ncbi:MAG: autotransporter strand-loop-strand O-heptosyltransferase [Selenomonadaceae bacterium]|nr:autotransporter strand-loop-strand O-heptosyltransferase [Selenomonadaceae bacterium]
MSTNESITNSNTQQETVATQEGNINQPQQQPQVNINQSPLEPSLNPQEVFKVYKYPVRFFYGPSLSHFPQEILGKILTYFHGNPITNSPIRGQTNIPGIKLDFNFGLRMEIPPGKKYRVRIGDYVNGLLLFDEEVENTTLISGEKFFIHWKVIIFDGSQVVFDYNFDPRGQHIHFLFHLALGDNITLFPYMDAFQRAHGCKISCTIPSYLQELAATYYPHIPQVPQLELPYDTYASYYMAACINMPVGAVWDSRAIPLVDIGKTILGDSQMGAVNRIIFKPTRPRQIQEKYVCIAVQASTTAKSWLFPGGWDIVVNFLKQQGYRVICIDRERETTNYGNTVKMPEGAEDFTGNIPLMERANMLAYADFFVGLSSGLSWIAWSMNIPVVMISGITESWYEFPTPYRVSNNMACHGCFNDLRVDLAQCYNCQRYANTDRQFECSKKIPPQKVLATIIRLINDLQNNFNSR